jgi:hypothetical protein
MLFSVGTVKYRLGLIDLKAFKILHSARIFDRFLNISYVLLTPEVLVRMPEHVIVFAFSY